MFPMLPVSRGALPYLKVPGIARSSFRLEQHEDEISMNLHGMVLAVREKN
jgi:hypothetical protein